jgi:putative ABC transport system permease protein
MGTLWQDVRYASRLLARSPGFAIVVVLILGLGIGANTAVFSIVNGVLLRPLPFKDPGRVVQILTQWKGGRVDSLNRLEDCLEVQKRSRAFAQVSPIALSLLLDTGGEEPRYLSGACVPARFFDLLGVQPLLGRGFRLEEEQPGKDGVVVLSHQYWTQRCGANPDIVGQTLVLQEDEGAHGGMTFREQARTVIGVMPAEFWCLDHRDVWMPLGAVAGKPWSAYLIARLRPHVSLTQAQAEADVIAGQLARERSSADRDRGFLLVSPRERMVADVQRTLWVLVGMVGVVLIIACANVANMLLARSLGRQREVAIRAALGAGRMRLVRQFLTESLLLSLLGGLCGLFLTVCSFGLIKALLPPNMPRVAEIQIDGRVLGFAMIVSILTGTLIGLAPILRVAEMRAGRTLKEGGLAVRGSIGRSRLHKALLVSEVALSLVLLIGAGLMVRSFRRLTSLDLGFDPKNVLVAEADPRDSLYPDPQVYFQVLMERVRQLPGVRTVALGNLWLFGGKAPNGFGIPGQEAPPDGQRPVAHFIDISEDYFQALRIPLLQGRTFTPDDRADTEPVVIVNQALVRRYFGDKPALGRTITRRDNSCRIVGVVADVRPCGFRSEATPTMYFPYRQPSRASGGRLIVRTNGDPLSVLKPVRRELLALTPQRPPDRIRTIDEMLDRQTAPMRLNMQLFGLFAGLALILAAVGVYGLMAFFVSQRTQEIGVRMALGARSADVLKAVSGQGFRLTLIGTGLGLAGSLALTRLISSLLYDISPWDPVTYALVSLLLIGVAQLACYLPARRAAKIDPMAALRYE